MCIRDRPYTVLVHLDRKLGHRAVGRDLHMVVRRIGQIFGNLAGAHRFVENILKLLGVDGVGKIEISLSVIGCRLDKGVAVKVGKRAFLLLLPALPAVLRAVEIPGVEGSGIENAPQHSQRAVRKTEQDVYKRQDRYFLDRVTNRIVEVAGGSLYSYEANYSGFLSLKAQREESLAASARKRQALLRKELAWIQQGAKARGTKARFRVERFEELSAQPAQKNAQGLELRSLSSRLDVYKRQQ